MRAVGRGQSPEVCKAAVGEEGQRQATPLWEHRTAVSLPQDRGGQRRGVSAPFSMTTVLLGASQRPLGLKQPLQEFLA